MFNTIDGLTDALLLSKTRVFFRKMLSDIDINQATKCAIAARNLLISSLLP